MGTVRAKPILRGLLVPDRRITFDAFSDSYSTYTEAGALPPVAEPQSETDMVLATTGTNDGQDLRLRAIRGGHPEPDGGGAFVWRPSGPSEDWRGWDPPVSLTGFEWIDRDTGGLAKWGAPHALALRDGTVVVVATEYSQTIKAWRRNADTGAWTESEVYDRGSTYTYPPTPCLVALPSGRLLCFFWREVGANYTIRAAYSDDSGATWTTAQKAVLAEPIDTGDYLPQRIRAAYLNGQIVLVAHLTELAGPEDQLWQYASNDLGMSFSYVSKLTGVNRGFPDVVAHNGLLYVGYVTTNGTPPPTATHPPAVRMLASAYADISAATSAYMQAETDPMEWGEDAAGRIVWAELSMWVDTDGVMYVIGRDRDTGTNELSVRTSFDNGATWSDPGGGPAASFGVSTWRGLDADTFPTRLAVFMHRGRAGLVHGLEADPGDADYSLALAWLGGYTTVCMPQESGIATSPKTVAGWTITWLPYDLPEATGAPTWASSTSGTPTVALDDTGVHIEHTGAGDVQSWVGSPAADLAAGVIMLAELTVLDGTGYVGVGSSDGVNCYWIQVRVTPTSIVLRDDNAGTTLATVTTTAGTMGIQVLAAVAGDACVAWYRAVDPAVGDRQWIAIGDSDTLTSAAFPLADASFGTLVGSATADVSFKLVCYADDSYTEEQLLSQNNPDDLLGRTFSATPTWVNGGTEVYAVDGPAYRNDDWDLDARYSYGVENLHVEVASSPRRPWRSAADSNVVELAWDLGASTWLLESMLGLYLGDVNFRTANLWGRNAMGTWVKLADIDTAFDSASLRWTRDGRVVRPDTSGATAAKAYYPAHVLAGSYIALDNGDNGTKVRKIETNASGAWPNTTGASTKRTSLLLTEVDGTEPTSGTAAAIWSKDYTLVLPASGNDRYNAFKLIIPAQETWEGYFRIGVLMLGHVVVLGHQYGRGRSLEWEASYELLEGRSGARSVQALAPVRRSVEVSWADGVETTGATGATPSPDYVAGYTGGPAVSAPSDTPYTVGGLVELLEGAQTPVVYLPTIPAPGSVNTPIHVTNRETMLYGRVRTETLKLDSVLGEEWGSSGEVFRVGVVRIEEEL